MNKSNITLILSCKSTNAIWWYSSTVTEQQLWLWLAVPLKLTDLSSSLEPAAATSVFAVTVYSVFLVMRAKQCLVGPPGRSEANSSHFSGWSFSVSLRIFCCVCLIVPAGLLKGLTGILQMSTQEFQTQGFEMYLSRQTEVLFFKRKWQWWPQLSSLL